MGGEAEMADIGAFAEPRGDHPPADEPLKPAQREQPDQARAIAFGDHPAPGIDRERQREGEADDAAEQAVDIFPEEDELEIGQRHALGLVDFLIFGDLLIFQEFFLPLRLGERGQRARHRPPLGDRQAGFGEAGDPAHDDHHENEAGDKKQPAGEPFRLRIRGGGTGKRHDGRAMPVRARGDKR